MEKAGCTKDLSKSYGGQVMRTKVRPQQGMRQRRGEEQRSLVEELSDGEAGFRVGFRLVIYLFLY